MADLLTPGTIGLIAVALKGQFGAIRTYDGRWAVKADDGLNIAGFDAVAAWRVPYADGGGLAAYLAASAARPFRFGVSDCALFVADWVRLVTGADPAAEVRGTYSDEAGWKVLVAREGGLVPLFHRLATGAGLARII